MMTLLKIFTVFYGVVQSLYFLGRVLEFIASGQPTWAVLWGVLVVLMVWVTIWTLRMIRDEEKQL